MQDNHFLLTQNLRFLSKNKTISLINMIFGMTFSFHHRYVLQGFFSFFILKEFWTTFKVFRTSRWTDFFFIIIIIILNFYGRAMKIGFSIFLPTFWWGKKESSHKTKNLTLWFFFFFFNRTKFTAVWEKKNIFLK